MIPEQKIKAIKAELVRLGCNQETIEYVIDNLNKQSKILSYDFTLSEFIAIAGGKNASVNVDGVVSYCDGLTTAGYSLRDIARIGLLPTGAYRLNMLSQFNELLCHYGFTKSQIVTILESNTGVSSLHAVVSCYDKLENLGFKHNDIVNIANEYSGSRLIAKIEANIPKLIDLAPQNIIEYLKYKHARPEFMTIIEPPIEYSKRMTRQAEERRHEFYRIKHSSMISNILTVDRDDDKAAHVAQSNPIRHAMTSQPEIPYGFNTVSTENHLLVQRHTQQASSTGTVQSQKALGRDVILESARLDQAKVKIHEILYESGHSEKYVREHVEQISPYISELSNLLIPLNQIVELAKLRHAVEAAKQLIQHMMTYQRLGYSPSEILEIVKRESGDMTLSILHQLHDKLTRDCGFSHADIYMMAKHGRGYKNLLAVYNNYLALSKDLQLTNEEIVEIVSRYNGYENIDAFLGFYSILITLNYNHDQIITLATIANARSIFNTILAYHSELMTHGFNQNQILDMVCTKKGIYDLSMIYYYLLKHKDQLHDANVLTQKTLEGELERLIQSQVIPDKYQDFIDAMANQKIKDLKNRCVSTTKQSTLQQQTYHLPSMMVPTVNATMTMTTAIKSRKNKQSLQIGGSVIQKIKKMKPTQTTEKVACHETIVSSQNAVPITMDGAALNMSMQQTMMMSQPIGFQTPQSSYGFFARPAQDDMIPLWEIPESAHTNVHVVQEEVLTTQPAHVESISNTHGLFTQIGEMNLDAFIETPLENELDELIAKVQAEENNRKPRT